MRKKPGDEAFRVYPSTYPRKRKLLFEIKKGKVKN